MLWFSFTLSPFFAIKDVYIGSIEMRDLQYMKVEMLKWTGKEAHVWISLMFNCALQHAMPHDWSLNIESHYQFHKYYVKMLLSVSLASTTSPASTAIYFSLFRKHYTGSLTSTSHHQRPKIFKILHQPHLLLLKPIVETSG